METIITIGDITLDNEYIRMYNLSVKNDIVCIHGIPVYYVDKTYIDIDGESGVIEFTLIVRQYESPNMETFARIIENLPIYIKNPSN